MRLRINNIKLPLDASADEVRAAALAKAGVREASGFRIVRRSVDARHGVCFVYAAELDIDGAVPCDGVTRVAIADKREPLQLGSTPLAHRPVIVGTGPAGLFAGLTLARQGYRPLLLERGGDVDARTQQVHTFWTNGTLDPNCNVQFGEGGAGTFSDGKLTTRTNDHRQADILADFHRMGADGSILYEAKPHIGTDVLKTVVKNLRCEIIRLGGEVRFHTQLMDIALKNGKLTGIALSDGTQLACETLILAIGHSARDTYQMLFDRGLDMAQKAFSIGVRAEHRQEDIDRARYGKYAGHPALGAADYQLSWRGGARACYSFCMCPGGTVVNASSEPGLLVTNGMSDFARDAQNANAALCVNVDGRDFESGHPLSGIAFQRHWERLAFEAGGGSYRAPVQLLGDFLKGRPSRKLGRVTPSIASGYTFAELHGCLPSFVCSALAEGIRRFERQIPGYADADAVLTGIETRTSAPVRILRDADRQAPKARGVYPTGEGAGYAGGIMSAAVDGIRTAEQIMREYRQPDG